MILQIKFLAKFCSSYIKAAAMAAAPQLQSLNSLILLIHSIVAAAISFINFINSTDAAV